MKILIQKINHDLERFEWLLSYSLDGETVVSDTWTDTINLGLEFETEVDAANIVSKIENSSLIIYLD